MAENTEFKVVVGADISEVKSKLAELSSLMGNLSNNVSNSTKQIGFSFSQLSSKMSSFGSNMTASLSVPLLLLGKSLFQSASQIEQASISLKVFTGDAGTAKRLLEEFKNIAINSPMQFQDIAKGAQTLMGYGVTANQVTPIIKMLGDISGGNADKFNRLSLAFGQVTASSKLMGQENRQMINAGFNPLLAISEKTGESMASLSKRMRDGKISVQEVADAFYYATSEGGRFNGMAMEQSETLGGLFNKLSESIFLALSDVGKALAQNAGIKDFFKSLSDSVTDLKNAFLSISPEWQSFILKVGATLILLGPIALAISSVIKVVLALRGAILLLTASTGGWLALIGLAVYGLSKLAQWFGETASKARSTALAVKGYKESLSDAMDIQKGFKFDSISAQITTLEGKVKSLTDIIEKNKAWNGGNSIISNKQIDTLNQYKKDLQNLKNIQQKNLGFSQDAPGTGKDLVQKDNKVYERLAQQARLGFTEVNKQIRTGFETKLDIFDRYAKEELDKLKEYGLNTLRVEQSQYKLRQQVAMMELGKLSAIVNKTTSIPALKESFNKMYEAQSQKAQTLMGLMGNSIEKQGIKGGLLGTILSDEDLAKFDGKTQVALSLAQNFAQSSKMSFLEMSNTISASVREMTQSIVSSFADMFIVIGSGGTAGDAIKTFGAGILNALGDMFIKIGMGVVMASKAIGAIQAFFATMFVPGSFIGGLAGGLALMAVGGLLKGASSAMSSSIKANQSQSSSPSIAQKASGSNYSYGGSSYSTQSIRLSIDLTGAITASPTGYNINKSLETVLRVTGRE